MTKLEIQLHLLNAKHRVERALFLLNKRNYLILLDELETLYEGLSEIQQKDNKSINQKKQYGTNRLSKKN